MQSRTVVKVIGAFLAGVLLALGAAIVQSRQTAIPNTVPPDTTGAITPAMPGRSAGNRVSPALRRQVQPADPAPSQSQKVPPPASKNSSLRRERRTAAEFAAPAPEVSSIGAPSRIVGERQQPQAESAGDRNPWSVPVPPLPPASIQSPPRTIPPAQEAKAAVPEPHVVTLPAGTTLSIRVAESLNSERNNEGDAFEATLDAPIISNGFIIADRRSRVMGRVVGASRAGRVKGLASLTLAVSEINTTDGQRVPIETDSYQKWGSSSAKGDTAKVVGGAALGAIIGALAGGGKGAAIGAGAGGAAGTGVALGTRGAPAAVPSESVLTFRIARPITITERFN